MLRYFFDCSEQIKSCPFFGLIDPCDKDGKKPAFVSYDEENEQQKWNAKVISNNRNDYRFIAIDNNNKIVELQDKKKCDVVLYTQSTICFVELKTGRANWVSEAIPQIENTIEAFGNDVENFVRKKAYICNNRHPNSNSS